MTASWLAQMGWDVFVLQGPPDGSEAGVPPAQLPPHRYEVDGIAPAQGWQDWWQRAVRDKREGAPWSSATEPAQTLLAAAK